jgi:hypothetical protein
LTGLFLAILAIAWIAVFLPAALRARRATPYSSAQRFKRRMRLIAPPRPPGRRAGGRWVVVPEATEQRARAAFRRGQRRRRRILGFLGLAAVVSGVVAAVKGGSWWELHLALDASLGLFVILLLEAKRRRAERASKVRRLERGPALDFRFNEPARATGAERR